MATAKKKHEENADMSACSDLDDDIGDDCSPLTDESIDFSSLKSVWIQQFRTIILCGVLEKQICAMLF
jgi:hypothetical protein